jgi:hypothetical protein
MSFYCSLSYNVEQFISSYLRCDCLRLVYRNNHTDKSLHVMFYRDINYYSKRTQLLPTDQVHQIMMVQAA